MPKTVPTVDDVALWRDFPAAFKRARLAAGVSQWQLEFEHHLGLHAVSQWERRVRRAYWPSLVRVCRTLGIEPADLFPDPSVWWHPTDHAVMHVHSFVNRSGVPRQEPAEWSSAPAAYVSNARG